MLAFIAVVLSVSLLGISSVYASDINGGQKKGILETVTDGVTGFVKNSAKGLANFGAKLGIGAAKTIAEPMAEGVMDVIDEKVFALGGVSMDKIAILEHLHFGGMAVFGKRSLQMVKELSNKGSQIEF